MDSKILVSLCIALVSSLNVQAKSVRYPRAESVSGKAVRVEDKITIENKVPIHQQIEVSVTKNTVLKDQVLLRTLKESTIRLQLSEKAVLILTPETEVYFPSIAWEDGAITDIRLNRGRIRYKCSEGCERKFETKLSEQVLPAGEYELAYHADVPEARLSVFAGEIQFRGRDNEVSVILKRGEQASFVGQFDSEDSTEVAYDVLLKGRRLAKGKLSPVQQVSPEELKSWEEGEKRLQKIAKAKAIVKRKPGEICDKPLAKLNDCVWIREKSQCLRRRCNANGQWVDETDLGFAANNELCGKKPIVKACDY